MFHFTQFNSKAFTEDIVPWGPHPSGWIEAKDLERRYKSVWQEHCLECAAPDCYGNCKYYVKRIDGKCQKTYYGIKNRKDLSSDSVCPAQLKFRKWGKIETVFSPSSLPAISFRRIERWCARFERVLAAAPDALKERLSRWRPFNVFNNGIVKYVPLTTESQPSSFVLQCFSSASSDYCLFFEIFGHNRHSIIRRTFHIQQGYNQYILSLSETVLDVKEQMWVRVFPENDFEAELVFFLCDFVDLKMAATVSAPAPTVKCVAWDLDNTIWDKTLIESNPEDLMLREGVKQAILDLDAKGILQVVVSKNYEKDVVPVLHRLGIYDFFVYVCANWLPKSQNLSAIAKLLNINIDSFVLIDDSAFERGEVTRCLGKIRVYDERIVTRLTSLPELDVPITPEAGNRRKMYQQEVQRKDIERGFSSVLSFLKDCRIKVTVEHIGYNSFERGFELLQRTNQLNLSGRRYQRDEFKEICDKDPENIFVFHCSDRYGDYGQIGLIYVQSQGKTLNINEFALSCRVAGKMVEPAILSWLMARSNADVLVLNGKDNRKNRLLIETLYGLGFTNTADDGFIALTITREKANWNNVVSVIDRTACYRDNKDME